MTTRWLYHLYLFLRPADATRATKTALAQIYVDHGSGESLANERKMFDTMTRLSVSGAEPAQVFGFSLTATQAIYDGIMARTAGFDDPFWFVVANTTLPDHADGELIALTPNLPKYVLGTVLTWTEALGILEQAHGLRVIPAPDFEAGETARLLGSTRAVNLLGRVPVPAYTTAIGERVWDAYAALARRLKRER